MRRTTSAARAVLAVLMALMLVGCGRTATRPPVVSVGFKDATFVYVSNVDIVTDWDPATSYSSEIIAMQNIYDSLTVYNPVTRRAGARLATDWTSTSDGRVWTFTLRPGVRFHTGRTLDAEAVKASIERTKRLAGGAAYIWDPVESIVVRDPLTVVFTLKYPAPLDLVASASYAAYIYDTQAAGGGDLKAWLSEGRDAGSGPYTVANWQHGRETELTLRAFNGFWGGWDGAHYKIVEYRCTPETTTAWQLLLRGEVSFVERLNPGLFRRARSSPGVRTSQMSSFQNLLVLFNTGSIDLKVRKAIQKAIDYDGVITALRGAGSRASGLVPDGLLGHVTDAEPRQDLAESTRLLAAAGYGPGKRELRLSLTYAQGDNDQHLLVTHLVNTLRKLNVTVDARAMQWSAQWAQAKGPKRQDILIMYWWPDYADAVSWFRNVFHSEDPVSFGLAYLRDSQVDGRIDDLPSLTATDRAGAQTAYAELQTTLIDRKAVVAVPWVTNYQRAYLGNIQGYTDNPAYPNVVFVHNLVPTG